MNSQTLRVLRAFVRGLAFMAQVLKKELDEIEIEQQVKKK